MASSGDHNRPFRLPNNTIPLHYDLDIITYLGFPDDKGFGFEGKVSILIKCLKPTDAITLHSRYLDIDANQTSVRLAVGRLKSLESSLEVVSTSYEEGNDFYTIKLAEQLKKEQEYFVDITFSAPLLDNLIGYYRSSYTQKSSKSVKYLAVTHFEPSDARQAFPCFDEPALKATFNIRLGHHKDYVGVSNMPLKTTNPFKEMPDFVWSEFETTVPMSTYLVAYFVSDFETMESVPLPNNIKVCVWARREAIEQANFSSMVGPKFLSFYEDFFGVKYPLPKQDLLAIPDFKIGAMENWGIITFRESALLLDEKTTSSSTKLRVTKMVAHELAHMWFGNLVTMKWWTDLWLKEGFATYMAVVAIHHLFPEWNLLDAEALSDLLRVFQLDSLNSSHPVSVPIGHPREIGQIFDAISYDKGSLLLRMMSLFLGEEVLRHGVSEYLKKHQFSNAEQDDLWASLTEQAHRYSVLPATLTVKQIMDTWTLQTGFPFLTVSRDYELQRVKISQKRYLATNSDDESDFVGSWWIPLSYSTEKEPHFNRTQSPNWLPQGEESIVMDIKASDNEWIVFNNRAAGLYKVNYDIHNWKLLTDKLHSPEFEDIDVMNRALLLIDVMDFAYSGILDYQVAVSLISYVKRETAFVPWSAALSKLEPIKSKLVHTPIYGTFKSFVRALLNSVLTSLGPIQESSDSFEKGYFLNLISVWACSLHVPEFTKQALALFNQWHMSKKKDPDAPNLIPKDLRRAVYSHAVEVGTEETWSFLWTEYKYTNVAAEKDNILMALTNTTDICVLNRYLEWTLSDAMGIRKQDAFLIFSMAATRENGCLAARHFFFSNINRISKYFGENSQLIGNYFSSIAEQMINPQEYAWLKAFSEEHQALLAPASLTVKQALEKVQINIRWMEKHYHSLSMILLNITSND